MISRVIWKTPVFQKRLCAYKPQRRFPIKYVAIKKKLHDRVRRKKKKKPMGRYKRVRCSFGKRNWKKKKKPHDFLQRNVFPTCSTVAVIAVTTGRSVTVAYKFKSPRGRIAWKEWNSIRSPCVHTTAVYTTHTHTHRYRNRGRWTQLLFPPTNFARAVNVWTSITWVCCTHAVFFFFLLHFSLRLFRKTYFCITNVIVSKE